MLVHLRDGLVEQSDTYTEETKSVLTVSYIP